MQPKPEKKPSLKASNKSAKAPVVKETIQAPHSFTPEELSALNLKLREHLDTIDVLTGDAKAAAQDFKLRITNHVNEAKLTRTKLASGQESREVDALVTFAPKKREKTYHHPVTKAEIRTEPMTGVDWQLPMFKPTSDGKSEVAAKKGESDVAPAAAKTAKENSGKDKPLEASPVVGKTPVGAAMNAAAALTDAPKVPFDMVHAETLDHTILTRHFKKMAKVRGWTEVQISAINDLLRECDTEKAMLEVIRPHTSDPAGTK